MKTNIGHTESAAGVAGLIKVLLMMNYGKIVPSLHLKEDKSNLNTAIRLNDYRMDIPTEVEDWEANEDGSRIGCVNSFGFGGSNCHAILEQKKEFALANEPSLNANYWTDQFVVISSATFDGLNHSLQQFNKQLAVSEDTLKSISYTSTCRRDHFPYRMGFSASSLKGILVQASNKIPQDKRPAMPVNIVFVYCGVGTTWPGMCSELINTDIAFTDAIKNVDKYLQPLTGQSMLETFSNPSADYTDPFLNHVAIFAVQVGLTEMWRGLGVQPTVIIGQSVGEVAAAYASGSLDLKTAVDVIYYRSKILSGHPGGSMMVVKNINISVLENLCDLYERKVTIAVYSSPIACTLSGETQAMVSLKADVIEYSSKHNIDIFIKDLAIDSAYHSHLVEPCMQNIRQKLNHLKSSTRSVVAVSTVTGNFTLGNEFQSGDYWAQNVRQPVLMSKAITTSVKEKHKNIFLEIGPKQVLRAHINDISKADTMVCLASMNYKKELSCVSSSIIELFENGVNIKWEKDNVTKGMSSIPNYAFSRKQICFIPEEEMMKLQGNVSVCSSDHMFLQTSGKGGKEFKLLIGKSTTPFVYDHFLSGALLVPGATYVEATFAIARMKFELPVTDIVVSIEFVNTHTPSQENKSEIDCAVTLHEDEMEIKFSKENRPLCIAKASLRKVSLKKYVSLKDLIETLNNEMSKSDIYNALEGFGFQYGPSLSLIEHGRFSGTECLVEINVPSSIYTEFTKTHIHPSVVDSVFQVFGILTSTSGKPVFPKGLGSMIVQAMPQQKMLCYATKTATIGKQTHFNAILLDSDGGVISELTDFHTQEISIEQEENSKSYSLDWCMLKPNNSDANHVTADSTSLIFGTKYARSFIESVLTGVSFDFVQLDLEDKQSWLRADQILHYTKKREYDSMVYAPFSNVSLTQDSSSIIYRISKHTFLCFSDLLIALSQTSIKVPIFVMTNNTQKQIRSAYESPHLCGSELWGMVRCVIHESLYPDIRLLDVDVSNCDSNTLMKVIHNGFPNETEIRIAGKAIWKSRLKAVLKHENVSTRKNIHLEYNDNAYLMTSIPNEINTPFWEICNDEVNRKAKQKSIVSLRMDAACIHSPALFPLTAGDLDPKYLVWPQLNCSGLPTICLEGKGHVSIATTTENKSKEGDINYFCYPISITTHVNIPSQFVFEPTDIPMYFPGLLTTSVILYHLAVRVPHGSNVSILFDDSTDYCLQIFDLSLKAQRDCCLLSSIRASCVDMPFILKEETKLKKTQCLIALTTLEKTAIETLITRLPNLKYIITLACLMAKPLRRWLAYTYTSLSVVELNTEEMFQIDELEQSLPAVRDTLLKYGGSGLNFQRSLRNDKGGEANPLAVPTNTLSLLESDKNLPAYVSESHLFRKTSCYLVIGGLTGLGWKIMEYIASMGGGYLGSISRRKPTLHQQNEINKLINKTDCCIRTYQGDITDIGSLTSTLNRIECELDGVPVKGIFNGAGVLADCLLVNMTEEQLDKVLKPKVLGSLNLHLCTQHFPLDFFVVHSSVVSVLGNTGQCNYGAANAFLDTLAHYRQCKGLNAQSLNWGPLSVGMAQENPEIELRLKTMGMSMVQEKEIYSLLQDALISDKCQLVLGSFSWPQIGKSLRSIKLEDLIPQDTSEFNQTKRENVDESQYLDKTTYFNLQDTQKETLLLSHIARILCHVFTIADTSSITLDFKISELGVDLFAGMTLINKIFDITGCRLPIQMVLSDETTLSGIVAFIKDNIQPVEKSNEASHEHPYLHPESKVSFIERSILSNYEKTHHKATFLRVFDVEIEGINWEFETWKQLLHHVVKMNREFCKRFIVKQSEVEVIHVEDDSIELEVELTSVEQIQNHDPREEHIFDLTAQIPIKFQIANNEKTTYLRIILHAVVEDLSTMTLLFKDLKNAANAIINGDALPKKHERAALPPILHKMITTRHHILRQFWSKQVRGIKKVVTLNKTKSAGSLDPKLFKVVKGSFPIKVCEKILDFIHAHKLTIFHFFISIYQLFIHMKTGHESIPVMTSTDLRIHAPELTNVVGRCVNDVPCIADVRKHVSFRDFCVSNSKSVGITLEHSTYPYELILDEIPSQEIRNNLHRHKLVMDNMTEFGSSKHDDNKHFKIKNLWDTSNDQETYISIAYDMDSKIIEYKFGYNSAVFNEKYGENIPAEILSLIQRCLVNAEAPVSHVLEATSLIETPKGTSTHSNNSINESHVSTRDNTTASVDSINQRATQKKDELHIHPYSKLCCTQTVTNGRTIDGQKNTWRTCVLKTGMYNIFHIHWLLCMLQGSKMIL